MEISRVALFGKLNSLAYKGIESATVYCKMRGNPYVELSHWLRQLLELPDSDIHQLVKRFQLEPARLAKDLTESLDKLPRGATSISDLSSHIEDAVERAWVYATLMFGDSQVRTGHLIVGILNTRELSNALMSISSEFQKIRLHELTEDFTEIVGGSPEEHLVATDGTSLAGGAEPGEVSGAMPPAQMGKQRALQQFSVDLTENARQGLIDPIIGRDEEIRQIVDILMRRRQNNPILTGEAGVGKTAVVEGFANQIASGDVPPPLRNVTLRALDVGGLQAGASMKGEFENRLKQVIEEVQSSEQPIILFIDEAHTLIGAGGTAGTGDAANLLKPALARGQLRTIAATTWAEYKKHIEPDPALTRRFQVIQVDEPSEEKAILMMRSIASTLENHHQVQLLDEALETSVRLSHRYIPARQLPDKSVALLDTTAARVAISQYAVPPDVEDCRRAIQALETELSIIGNESAIGIDTQRREKDASEKLSTEKTRLVELEERWDQERSLVESILGIRAELRGTADKVEETDSELEQVADDQAQSVSVEDASAQQRTDGALDDEQRTKLLAELSDLQSQLDALQGETPLILPSVDHQAVASVVADWTGIPVGKMVRDEVNAILSLANTLNQRIIGQTHALEMIAKRIQTSRASLDNPMKPIGVFLLCGPSGVGKTETALALAEAMYGGEQNVITINMSEFQEAHTVSTLKGAPPGYVGYGEGGVLTEAVRRRPYSVVLLDEVEKAHSDVHEIFFQVFDKGIMEDGEGRLIDFKNTLILLTSNVGTDLIMNMCKDPELMPAADAIGNALRKSLLDVFPAALLGRLVTIPYFPLNDEMISQIARLQLGRIKRRVQESHDARFDYDDEVVDLIVSRCTELESGGRMIDTILTNTLLPKMSREFLTRMMEGQPIPSVRVTVEDGEFGYGFE